MNSNVLRVEDSIPEPSSADRPSPSGTEALHLLLVTDSAAQAQAIVRELKRMRRPIEFERVETGHALRTALREKVWDSVICDWSMSRLSATRALGILKACRLDFPFIIVAGTIDDDAALAVMRAGANDYVMRNALARLTPALERALQECNDRRARRRAEEDLRESQARFRTLADSGIIGIVITDAYGNILEANDTYIEMVRYSREELLRGDLRWVDLTPPEFRHLTRHALLQLKTAGVVPAWKTESLRKDGTRVPMLAGLAMLEYPKCIAFTADLTELKAAEAGRTRAEAALFASEERPRPGEN